MIILRESLGDIKLLKFLGFRISKVEGLMEANYDENIGAYLFYEEYDWNSLDGSGDNQVLTHERIAADLPNEFNNAYIGIHIFGHMDVLIAGGIDIFVEEDYSLKLWMYHRYWNDSKKYNEIKNYLERKFRSYLKQRVIKPE